MIWAILGTYAGQGEEIDTAETRPEAMRLLGEYRTAFGAGWQMSIKRRKRTSDD